MTATVLHFDATLNQSVLFSGFWPINVSLGPCFWEFLIKREANGQYFISEGYGGAHAILAGFQTDGTITGNMWNGTTSITFGSGDGPAVGEWAYMAVAWDGAWITVYYNGVLVGYTAFAGPRQAQLGQLFLAGSDHQNFMGSIAQIRAWEGSNPLAAFTPYTPELLFEDHLRYPPSAPKASFLTSFMSQDLIPTDRIGGRVGQLRTYKPTGFYLKDRDTLPLPAFVDDPTMPDYDLTVGIVQPITTVPTPPATPPGAKIFDSYSRANLSLAFGQNGGLGSTETGSLGSLPYTLEVWGNYGGGVGVLGRAGIQNGRAVNLDRFPWIAWMNNDSSNMDVRVDRAKGNYNYGKNTGIAFRVLDHKNFLFVATWGNTARYLRVGKVINGVQTDIVWSAGNGTALSATFTTLRVVASGDTVTTYYDNGAGGWIQTDQQTIADLDTATGVGITQPYVSESGIFTWDNFTVL